MRAVSVTLAALFVCVHLRECRVGKISLGFLIWAIVAVAAFWP